MNLRHSTSRILVFLAVFLAGMAVVRGAAPAAGSGGAGHPESALWIWSWDDPQDLAEYVAGEGFDRAYLYCQGGFDPDVRQAISALSNRGVKVEALGGERNWATSGTDGMIRFIRAARRYQRSAAAGRRLAGIHLDVEPHALDAWDRHPARTRHSFLLALRKAGKAAGPLPLAADIPFWFDGIRLARRGHSVSFSAAILGAVDAVTVMAYRDDPAEIIGISRTELKQAARQGKPLTIGVETGRTTPEHVTFFEEGRAALDEALARIGSVLAGSRAFAGTAVHSYGSLTTLTG